MKLRLCWTEAPARWAEANFPGEVVGVIGGVKSHMISQALEDDLVAVLRKHSEPHDWQCDATPRRGDEEQAKRKQIREDNLIGEAGI